MNGKNNHMADDDSGFFRGEESGHFGNWSIYVDSAGTAHLLVDLPPDDFRVVTDRYEGVRKSATNLDSQPVFRGFDMPRHFEEAYGHRTKFADPEHSRYVPYENVLFDSDKTYWAKSEFEAILYDILDHPDAHIVFSRIVPDLRRIADSQSDTVDGLREALVHRDPKTWCTLASALYRFSLAPIGRRVRELASALAIQPYDSREMATAKIEGYCRNFRSFDGTGFVSDFEDVKALCDRIARGAYADVTTPMGETLFSILLVQMSNPRNYEWAARGMDVLLNELVRVRDPKHDPIDPFRLDVPWRTIDERIRDVSTDERLSRCAASMLVRIRAFLSDSTKYGQSSEWSASVPESVMNVKRRVDRAYRQNHFD